MSDVTDHNGMPEDELLAAEYALGVLAGADRAAAERRIARDHAFAALGRRLGRAACALGRRDRRSRAAAAGLGRASPPPCPRQAPQARRPVAEPRLLAHLRACRARSPPPASPRLSISARSPAKRRWSRPSTAAAIIISSPPSTPDAAPLPWCRRPSPPTPRRVPELWLIPADGKPRPLGLLQRRPHRDHRDPARSRRRRPSRNAVLAVSLEPPGGSPTGQPTGPVIATGKLTNSVIAPARIRAATRSVALDVSATGTTQTESNGVDHETHPQHRPGRLRRGRARRQPGRNAARPSPRKRPRWSAARRCIRPRTSCRTR